MKKKNWLAIIICIIVIVIIDVLIKLNTDYNFQNRVWIIFILSIIPAGFITYFESRHEAKNAPYYFFYWFLNTCLMFCISGIAIWILSWIPGL